MNAVIALFLFLFSSASFATAGLVIHSEEFGVGKFHRYDNKVHPYPPGSAWLPYVLPDNAATDKALIVKNTDASFTIFFSTLEELTSSVVEISQSQKMPVSVLNVHGHGLPGNMWFPKDAATLSNFECYQWQQAATGSDEDNYNQYYSELSVDEIMQIRQMSNGTSVNMGCTVGLNEWQVALQKNPAFKQVFAGNSQIHFLSCVVGLGNLGNNFVRGIAALLLPQGSGHVEASMDFGLGDWSMPQGMGFWDYQSNAQVNHDNSVYVVDHKDLEIAQKGTIRIASFSGAWGTNLLANRDFLPLGFENSIVGDLVHEQPFLLTLPSEMPSSVRLPGTNVRISITH